MARPPLFRRAKVIRIVKETPDTRTFVLEPEDGPFSYRAGQFCTFKITVDGKPLFRSYSMSSAPETDTEFMTTVKRVPGGAVSNWMHDNLSEGDEVELTVPTGRFCLRDGDVPVLGFSGGSGITPIISLAKSTLASTDRKVRLLCADRDRPSAIFEAALDELVAKYPDRLTVLRHRDDEHGYVDAAKVLEFVGDSTAGDAYICGPEPFMELVENALPGPGRIFSERFGGAPVKPAPPATTPTTVPAGHSDSTAAASAAPSPPPAAPQTDGVRPTTSPTTSADEGTVTIFINRKKKSVPRRDGETLLESARRAGLTPPFSCESGNCATCMAKLTEGKATMRVNDALTDDDLQEGYILTCQAVPDTPSVTVRYE
ncbi:ferredoxin--NADP reductase [Nocardia flavorosea]|uniref:Ferredoxin--NADP reductase n=1 Tax=Nocardia flavorosea TaxID=53429 RepID=A0A846YF32_9NOCA|nr:ferredoxin--NADP reductase [Nocardia flavorosea]NKY57633.1 ferredoxin--NADP reductase [Nocardia flavorosea]